MIISDLRLVHLPPKTSAPYLPVLGGGARFVIFWLSERYMPKTGKSAPPPFQLSQKNYLAFCFKILLSGKNKNQKKTFMF